MTLSNQEWERRARGRRVLAATYYAQALDRAGCLLAIADCDPANAGRYATRTAHHAQYAAWVKAKLDGSPYLAPISTRPPVSWTDPTRMKPPL
jgi:hypothetical protein